VSKTTTTTHKLGKRRSPGSVRLWLESGVRLRAAGFLPGDDEGSNKVSESHRDGNVRPIIDIAVPTGMFAGNRVDVIWKSGRLDITNHEGE
jgi:hypothetical protein